MKVYQKILLYILIIAIGVMIMTGIKTSDIGENRKFVNAFSTTTFQIQEAQLHIWGEYMPKFMEAAEIKSIVYNLAKELELNNYSENYEETDEKKTFEITKISDDATTSIKFVEIVSAVEDATYRSQNYLIVDIALHNKVSSVTYFQEQLEDYFNAINITPKTGLSITAVKNGVITDSEAKEVMAHLIEALSGEVKSVIMEKELKSMYGYTQYVNNYVTSNGEKINLDIAVTYNELEDKTYLYGAIPVITFEY